MGDQKLVTAAMPSNPGPPATLPPSHPGPAAQDGAQRTDVQRADTQGAADDSTNLVDRAQSTPGDPPPTIEFDGGNAANWATLPGRGDDTVSDRTRGLYGGPRIGEYEIEQELGRGGMGVVYKARHGKLDRLVALKMILAGPHADEAALSRFRVEGQAVAKLQHPGIVQIFELGEHNGLPYFVLEYVAGKSLLHRIVKELPAPAEAARLLEQLARTMQYAHDQGILHRDLKPANVLLTPEGEPKVGDFGLAKSLGADSAATASGTILGTPSYMSPEQARGQVSALTPATDQYSLGAILYHLLTGRAPFVAANPLDTLLQVMHEEPVAPRQLSPKTPADLETICLKALAKEPARRYANCRDLADDLNRFLTNEPIVARPISRAERLWRWCRRNPRIAIPTAASALLFLVAFAVVGGSALVLSNLNSKLVLQTAKAQAEATIANDERGKAQRAQKSESQARELADQRADVLLQTSRDAFTEIKNGIGRRPGLESLKLELLRAIARGLEKLPDLTGRSGITTAATRLIQHKLMYELYLETGETDKAWPQIVQAHEIARQRILDQNNSSASRLNLASICKDMAKMRQQYKRDLQVSKDFALEAVALYDYVLKNPVAQKGDLPRLQVVQLLSQAQSLVATIFVRLGNPAEALRHFELTKSTRESIFTDPEYLKLPPDTQQANASAVRQEAAVSLAAIGEMQFRLGRYDDSAKNYGEAVVVREETYAQFPTNPPTEQLNRYLIAKYALATLLSQSGSTHARMGKSEKGAALLKRAVALAGELVQVNAGIVDYQRALALAHFRTGVVQALQGDPAAKASFDECLKIRQALAKDASNVDRQRELLLVLPRAGRHSEAAQLAEKILKMVAEPDVELLLDLARAAAQSSVAAGDDMPAAAAYRKQALAQLTKAVDAGHRDSVYLETEPDFENLWKLDDFRDLVARERMAMSGGATK